MPNFNIVAQVQLRGPNNIRQIANQIRTGIGSIRSSVQINIANNVNTRLQGLNRSLGRINTSLQQITTNAGNAQQALVSLAAAITGIRNRNININVRNVQNAARQAQNAADSMRAFGEQSALAIRRFAAFAAPTGIFLGLVGAIKDGISEAINFEKEMTKLSQVTGRSLEALSGLSSEITRLATGLGTSSKELGDVATTLAQAGLNADDTKKALEALARSSLAATFTDIKGTTEGAIAVFRQFNVSADQLQGVIGSLNAVSAQFAVESDDLVSVIRRTGGAFKASGGNLNELLGLFTSVRATTRESADSIATGFRTIFTRIQRPRTIQFLKELGVELRDAQGKFAGPTEAIRSLSEALRDVPSNDPRFASIVEELGGFRQVSKVIPLLQQFPEALKAIQVAEQGQLSIVEDSEIAQQSLANQIVKVKEEFLALFRELTSDKSLRFFITQSLDLAKAIIEITRNLKQLAPLIGTIGLIQGARAGTSFGGGFLNHFAPRRRFASGGSVPGHGSGDTVPAMLTPGEFVIRKSAAKAIGHNNLQKINKYANGGPVRQFGLATLTSKPVSSKFTTSVRVPDSDGKTRKETVEVLEAGLKKEISDNYVNVIRDSATNLVKQLANDIAKTAGTTIVPEGEVNNIFKKANYNAIPGAIFEAALASAGAPYQDKDKFKGSIDFPEGLRGIAPLFGLPGNIPTDATNSTKSNKRILGQIIRFLKNERELGSTPMATAKKASSSNIAALLGKITSADTRSGKEFTLSDVRRITGDSKLTIQDALSQLNAAATPEQRAQFGLADPTAKKQLKIKKFAKGGSAGTDTVPAMLTPGEFVINRDSARKIGSKNLHALNNAKGYARGGSVGSSFTGGAGIAAIAILPQIASTFGGLDKETNSLINKFTALGVSVAGLTLTLNSAINTQALQERGNLLSRVARTPSGRGLAFALQHVDKFTAAVGVASVVLTTWGESVNSNAEEMAKLAKNETDLNSAIEELRRGNALKGAGSGAGGGALVGGAVGSAFGPLGTLIGLGAGALIGGGIGAALGRSTADTESLRKVNRQARFDDTLNSLTETLESLTTKGKLLNSVSGAGIASNLESIFSQIKNTRGLESIELKKQLRNQNPNIRELANQLVDVSDSIEDFKTKFGGAGNQIIQTLALLNNKSLNDMTNTIEKEIQARLKGVEASKKISNLNFENQINIEKITAFANAIKTATDEIVRMSSVQETISSAIEGNITGGKFTGLSSGIFSRAAEGGVPDSVLKRSFDSVTGGLLSGSEASKLFSNVKGFNSLSQKLPSILRQTAASTGIGGTEDDVKTSAEQAFENIIDAIATDVPAELKALAKARFGKEIASRESSGESGFLKEFRDNPRDFANKILNSEDSVLKALDELSAGITEQTNILLDRIGSLTKAELEIVRRNINTERASFDAAKSILGLDEKNASLADIKASFTKEQGIALGGTGIAASASAAELGAALRRFTDQRTEAEKNLQGASSATEREALAKEIGELNTSISKVRLAMDNMANASNRLSDIQKVLAKAESERLTRREIGISALFGGRDTKIGFNRANRALGLINGGRANLRDFEPGTRSTILDLASKFETTKSSLFGGKTGREFINDQIAKSVTIEGRSAGASEAETKKVIDALTKRSKTEEDARAEFKAELERSVAALSANTDAVKGLPDSLKASISAEFKSISDALISSFKSTSISGLKSKVATTTGSIEKLTDEKNTVSEIISLAGSFQSAKSALSKNVVSKLSNLANIKSTAQAFAASKNQLVEVNNENDIKELKATGQNFGLNLRGDLVAANQKISKENLKEFVKGRLASNVSIGEEAKKIIVDSISKDLVISSQDFNEIEIGHAINGLIKKGLDSAIATSTTHLSAISDLTDKQINNLTESGNLDKLNKLFDNLSSSTKESIEPLEKLNESIKKLGKARYDLDAEITKVKNAKAPFIEEAKSSGGVVGLAGGGRPPRRIGTDTVPALLTPGEYVIRRAEAKRHGNLLEAINAGKLTRFQSRVARNLEIGRKRQEAKDKFKAPGVPVLPDEVAPSTGPKIFAPGKLGRIQRNKALKEARDAVKARVAAKKARDKALPKLDADLAGGGIPELGFPAIPPVGGAPLAARPSLPKRKTVAEIKADVEKKKADASRRRGVPLISTPSGGLGLPPSAIKEYLKDDAEFAARRHADALHENATRVRLKRESEFFRKRDLIDAGKFGDPTSARVKALREKFNFTGKFAAGGPVPGSGNSDTVPALLTPGEFVLNKAATKALGMSNLHGFNARFAAGGLVKGAVSAYTAIRGAGKANGAAAGGSSTMQLSNEAVSAMQSFAQASAGMATALGRFNETSNTLATALSNWGASASRLSEAISSFPSEIQVNHSAIPVNVNVTGMESLKGAVVEEVLSKVDERLNSQRNKANDGKTPFFQK